MIAHRDLKLENVLVGAKNSIKIVDFGLANLMKDGKFLKTSCGSLNYAAPEIIQGKPYCGTEADVWSCGVILYVLLVGALPFEDDNRATLIRKIAEGQYSIPAFVNLSDEARDLIAQILKPNPTHRLRLFEIRKHQWFQQAFPLYYDLGDYSTRLDNFKLDEELFGKLLQMNFTYGNLHEDQIRRLIQEGKEHSFVVAYDLLADSTAQKKRQAEGIHGLVDLFIDS